MISKETWVKGRRGSAACLQIREYDDSVVVSAEDDKITPVQMCKALEKLYPRLTFYASKRDGFIYAQADVVKGEAKDEE